MRFQDMIYIIIFYIPLQMKAETCMSLHYYILIFYQINKNNKI